MPTPARPSAPFTARYGTLGQSGEWHEAVEAYYRDEMPQAYAMALGLGAGFGGSALGWYRMIEGEALTRERAEIIEVTPWLSFEAVEALDDARRDTMVEACERVATTLGWDFAMPVRVAILLPEVDAPWHGARAGYCVDKYPYDKVCIPDAAYQDKERLAQVMAHEYTHVVNLNLTQGRIPHWLDEGLAMTMEGAPPREAEGWMEPDALNAAFEADRREGEGLVRSHHAYEQAAFIVRHLRGLRGDEGLARLVHAFTDHGLWAEIKIAFGEPSVEEALHDVYGFGQRELFAAARD